MASHHIVTLPGDGIGPEIMVAATRVLDAVGSFDYEEHPFGGAAIDAHGTPLTDETVAACRSADAVLLAAVGGPKWDSTDPSAPRPEQGLLGLRKALGLYANLRPVRPVPALYDASPLKRELIDGTDMLLVRELTGGIYFGEKRRTETYASDLCEYSVAEIERIARTAFRAARTPRRATSTWCSPTTCSATSSPTRPRCSPGRSGCSRARASAAIPAPGCSSRCTARRPT
jgi:3-isopropylmalate dehydrogenase